MRPLFRLLIAALLLLPFPSAGGADNVLSIKGVRYFSYPTFTRVVFEIDSASPYTLTRTADGRSLVLSAYGGRLVLNAPLPAVRDGVIGELKSVTEGDRLTVFIGLEASAGEIKDFTLRSPDRIVLDVMKATAPAAEKPAAAKRVVVIDPGHGGRDGGIVTPGGVEKTLTLRTARLLERQLAKLSPALSVTLTRDGDRDLSLDERAAAANAAGAAIFVSLHASPGRGIRVFFGEPAAGPADRRSAAPADFLGMEAASEEQSQLWGWQQAAHTVQSSALAREVARHAGAGDGPLQAPLALLRSVDAAAVLIEIGSEENAATAAEGIARAIERHVKAN